MSPTSCFFFARRICFFDYLMGVFSCPSGLPLDWSFRIDSPPPYLDAPTHPLPPHRAAPTPTPRSEHTLTSAESSEPESVSVFLSVWALFHLFSPASCPLRPRLTFSLLPFFGPTHSPFRAFCGRPGSFPSSADRIAADRICLSPDFPWQPQEPRCPAFVPERLGHA